MTLILLKGVVSGVIVVLVNLLARRDPTLGGVVVGFPVITVLSILWLAVDGSASRTIEEFVGGVLWGLIPTFTFVAGVVLGVRAELPLGMSLAAGALLWTAMVGALVATGRIAL